MPLVPSNTVSRWYRKDSWVYRNFTYLFKNQLWNKDVPTGFSLCPYFWLALFSMTVFRVFVGAVLLTRMLFKPFGNLLGKMDHFLATSFGGKVSEGSIPGVPTFITALIAFAGCSGIYGAVKGAIALITSYTAAGALPALFIPFGLVVLGIVCGCYYSATQYRNNRCKVEYYLRIGLILGLCLGYWTMPNELTEATVGIGYLFWELIRTLGHFLYHTILGNVWHFIVYCCSGVYHSIVDHLVFIGSAIVGVLLMSIFGYATSAYIFTEEKREAAEKRKALRDKATSILKEIAHDAWGADNFNNHASRNRDYWKAYIWSVPEAVALAYHLAQQGKVSDDAYNTIIERAKKAALDTLEFELKLKQQHDVKTGPSASEMCHKVSTKLAYVCELMAYIPRQLVNGLIWLFKELWTFTCLMFSLIKAKKQGACPYLKFTDVVPTDKMDLTPSVEDPV